MSTAANKLRIYTAKIRIIERTARKIAKQNGVKVRKHPYSGINVKYPDNKKKRYNGWVQLHNELSAKYGGA